MRLTHVGGPTVLVELEGWRILTDPTFDPPGQQYGFGWGTSSTKTTGPSRTVRDVGPVDAVLLSHDHHADNLDDAGRAVLAEVPTVVTTRPARRRLRGQTRRAVGLTAGRSTQLTARGRPTLTVTASPCRHGPPLSRPVAGAVIGFALSLPGEKGVRLWMTGDSVLHRPLRRFAEEVDVDVLLLHLGAVRFPRTGRLRYSMDGADGRALIGLARPRTTVPVHYEGWSHFSEPEAHVRSALDAPVPAGTITWLTPGEAQELDPT